MKILCFCTTCEFYFRPTECNANHNSIRFVMAETLCSLFNFKNIEQLILVLIYLPPTTYCNVLMIYACVSREKIEKFSANLSLLFNEDEELWKIGEKCSKRSIKIGKSLCFNKCHFDITINIL